MSTAAERIETLTKIVEASKANDEMARATVRRLGVQFIWRTMTAREIAMYLESKGFSWDDVLRENS